MTLHVSDHAVERFNERVRPTLDRPAAKRELLRLVSLAERSTVPPDWHLKEEHDADYLHLSDGIACTVKGRSVTTVLIRGSHSDLHRAERKRRKAKKRAEKRWQNGLNRGRQRRQKETEWA